MTARILRRSSSPLPSPRPFSNERDENVVQVRSVLGDAPSDESLQKFLDWCAEKKTTLNADGKIRTYWSRFQIESVRSSLVQAGLSPDKCQDREILARFAKRVGPAPETNYGLLTLFDDFNRPEAERVSPGSNHFLTNPWPDTVKEIRDGLDEFKVDHERLTDRQILDLADWAKARRSPFYESYRLRLRLNDLLQGAERKTN